MTVEFICSLSHQENFMVFQADKRFPQMNQASRVVMSNAMLLMSKETYGQIHHTGACPKEARARMEEKTSVAL